MARFSGDIGFAETQETLPGNWEDVIVEHHYFGDVLQNSKQNDQGDQVIADIRVTNSISVVADAFLRDNYLALKYLRWLGVRWLVTDVKVAHPRLILQIGGRYNGPTPAPAGSSSTP